MSAWPSVPAGLHLPWGLALLLLLACPRAVRGDCGLPPDVPNAQPDLGGSTNFSEGHVLTYRCNEGFVKVPGMPDSVTCVNNKWSDLGEFCNRSCEAPPRLIYASLKKPFSEQNSFPVGSTVEYECRLGYRRDPSKSPRLTCLQDLTWSTPGEFCKKKSCPNPGDLTNGVVNIQTDILFGSSITFSCNEGYKLLGPSTSFCVILDTNVGWSESMPVCTVIYCPQPSKIENGFILNEVETYSYSQTVTYRCNKGFTMVGEHTLYCTAKNDEGQWSGPPPMCRGKSPPLPGITTTVQKPTTGKDPSTVTSPTTQKPTTGSAPGTETPTTTQKPTTGNAPGTKAPTTTQKPTTVNVPATQVGSVPRTTTQFYSTTISKDKESSSSGSIYFVYGHTYITLTVLLMMLVTIG
ncbi:complement decay-accelerating factor isoform X4 [Tupaia chinensis]|uniref:complement decay-accelerating factor isoform X4 n=1 Tax=Tupaia chinensis TaxID=246437 RepID=UPI0003C900CF|nr:complement decay-accelerating factor isoform X4 [Tupaia chinensis]